MGRRSKDLSSLYETAEEACSCVVAFTQTERQLLMRHARQDGLVSPLPGLFVRAEVWEDLNPNDRIIWATNGLAAIHDDWTFCGTTAALVHGLRVSYACSTEVCVVTDHKKRGIDGREVPVGLLCDHPLTVSFEQVSPHRLSLLGSTKVDGVRVISPIETVCDCLARLDFSNGLVLADSYLSKSDLDADGLCTQLEKTHITRRGIARAKETAQYADGRAESGGESFARARMIANGYEIPDLQVSFVDPVDGGVMRADFVWRDTAAGTIIGEFDGLEKYIDPEMSHGQTVDELLVRQNMRDSRLGLFCDSIFHFGWKDVKDDYAFCRILDSYRVPWAS